MTGFTIFGSSCSAYKPHFIEHLCQKMMNSVYINAQQCVLIIKCSVFGSTVFIYVSAGRLLFILTSPALACLIFNRKTKKGPLDVFWLAFSTDSVNHGSEIALILILETSHENPGVAESSFGSSCCLWDVRLVVLFMDIYSSCC